MAQPVKRFVLEFNTSLGRVGRISIPRARVKTDNQVEIGMEALANVGALCFSGGTPIGIREANLVVTERRRVS